MYTLKVDLLSKIRINICWSVLNFTLYYYNVARLLGRHFLISASSCTLSQLLPLYFLPIKPLRQLLPLYFLPIKHGLYANRCGTQNMCKKQITSLVYVVSYLLSAKRLKSVTSSVLTIPLLLETPLYPPPCLLGDTYWTSLQILSVVTSPTDKFMLSCGSRHNSCRYIDIPL